MRIIAALLFLAASAAWPFFMKVVSTSADTVVVLPSSTQHITSSRRGKDQPVEFLLQNPTEQRFSLNVAAKSCGCINVEIDPPILEPYSSSEVTLSIFVPYSGELTGALAILAEPADHGGEAKRIHLDFILDVEPPPGLEVAPKSLTLSGESLQYPVFSLTVPHGAPLDTLSVLSEGVPMKYRLRQAWTKTGNDRMAAVIEVKLDTEQSPRPSAVEFAVDGWQVTVPITVSD